MVGPHRHEGVAGEGAVEGSRSHMELVILLAGGLFLCFFTGHAVFMARDPEGWLASSWTQKGTWEWDRPEPKVVRRMGYIHAAGAALVWIGWFVAVARILSSLFAALGAPPRAGD